MRAGQPLPDRIANAPELINGLQMYINAFFDLDSERTHAFSLTSIPWSCIDRYATRYGLDDEQYDDMHTFIRRMDNAHLTRLKSKQQTG